MLCVNNFFSDILPIMLALQFVNLKCKYPVRQIISIECEVIT